MTRIEVIDALKTELSKTYVIQTTYYKDGAKIKTEDTEYPNTLLTFDRPVIETALELLEGQYDI